MTIDENLFDHYVDIWTKSGKWNGNEHSIYGAVFENCVQTIFNLPVSVPVPGYYDDGYDYVRAGMKIDAKCVLSEYKNWKYPSIFSVKYYDKPLKADIYEFGKIDKVTKQFEIIGWLTKDEVWEFGTHFHKGEAVPCWCFKKADYSLILIDEDKIIHQGSYIKSENFKILFDKSKKIW